VLDIERGVAKEEVEGKLLADRDDVAEVRPDLRDEERLAVEGQEPGTLEPGPGPCRGKQYTQGFGGRLRLVSACVTFLGASTGIDCDATGGHRVPRAVVV